jgi:hypothetical protein
MCSCFLFVRIASTILAAKYVFIEFHQNVFRIATLKLFRFRFLVSATTGFYQQTINNDLI